MTNPFDAFLELFEDDKDTKETIDYEEVGGAMSCQRYNCDGVATEGRYYYNEMLLEYTCPKGHENRCEGISI